MTAVLGASTVLWLTTVPPPRVRRSGCHVNPNVVSPHQLCAGEESITLDQFRTMVFRGADLWHS